MLAAAANAAAVSSRTGRPVIFYAPCYTRLGEPWLSRLRGPKLLVSVTPIARRQDHWRRIVRRIFGDRLAEVGLRGPVAPEARRRRAAVLRLDFLAAGARL